MNRYFLQQTIAVLLFVYPFRKRTSARWYALPVLLLFIYAHFFWTRYQAGTSWQSLVIFLLTGLLIYAVFDLSVKKTVFSCVGAYMILSLTIFVRATAVRYLFGITLETELEKLGTTLLFMALIYPIAWLLFVRRCKDETIYEDRSTRLAALSLIAILGSSGTNMLLEHTAIWDTLLANFIVIIGHIQGITILTAAYDRDRSQYEKKVMEHLVLDMQKKYALSKENIDIINTKCHDMRHQIAHIRHRVQDGDVQAMLKETEKAIAIYDTMVKTGNDTLDSIIMEKRLICDERHIQFSTMVDGAALQFMSTVDICTLFGNAIENAIESVSEVEEEDRRIVSLRVSRLSSMTQIFLENYCADVPEILDGLPQTTKADHYLHGFGTKSIKSTTEKYGGTATFRVEDHFFKLTIFFPCLDEHAEAAS